MLVSSNPTNLVLAGAFGIKFIGFTVNVIVPVLGTIILLFPCLLWLLFRKDGLIPHVIELEELPENIKNAEPVNPNIPQEYHKQLTPEEQSALAISTVLNPYLDKKSAIVGVIIMSATLVTILVMNATSSNGHEHPVFWVTLPAAVLMLSWDICFGWIHRHESRQLAANSSNIGLASKRISGSEEVAYRTDDQESVTELPADVEKKGLSEESVDEQADTERQSRKALHDAVREKSPRADRSQTPSKENVLEKIAIQNEERTNSKHSKSEMAAAMQSSERRTLHSETIRGWKWLRRTFPASSVVMTHLPFPLVPFALCMFVLVQALVTKGWVAVFAYGWDHWVDRTGVVGAIGGMGFLSIVLCNVG